MKWFRDTSGTPSASFTIVNLQPAAAGLYAATVSNLGGATATTPAIAKAAVRAIKADIAAALK